MHENYERNIRIKPRLRSIEVRLVDGSAICSLDSLRPGDALIVPTLMGYALAKVSRNEVGLVADTGGVIYSLVLDLTISRVIATHAYTKRALVNMDEGD